MKIWQVVKAIERKTNPDELAQARAYMIANFGPCGELHNGLITGKEPLKEMLKAVFSQYERSMQVLRNNK